MSRRADVRSWRQGMNAQRMHLATPRQAGILDARESLFRGAPDALPGDDHVVEQEGRIRARVIVVLRPEIVDLEGSGAAPLLIEQCQHRIGRTVCGAFRSVRIAWAKFILYPVAVGSRIIESADQV